MRHILIREWENLPIGPGGITEDQADALHLAALAAARRLKLPHYGVLERGYNCLRSRQVCGVLIAGGVHLEILPKLEDTTGNLRRTLVHMLTVAFDIPIAEGHVAELDVQNQSLLDTFVHLFLTRLNEQARQGLMRHYVETEDVLPKLRGRLDLRQQIQRRSGNPTKLHCRFEELSEGIALNRVFKACLERLRFVARVARTRRVLEQLCARFAAVPASGAPLRETVQWNRMNARFRSSYDLAIMLLTAFSQSTTTGSGAGIALLFPMNDLFERYVGRSLQRAFPPGAVSLQDRKHHLLTGNAFLLKPDIVITTFGGPVILDTKWKDAAWEGGKPQVQSADLYQMAAYAQAYKAQRVILVYPSGGSGMARKKWRYEATGVEVILLHLSLAEFNADEIISIIRPSELAD